ncbi:hypothetical protein NDU88_006586 [Pleurodeles waltl]|uniref:Uncharacterized protein n=1 Tax=Pleurodeles waltl TaxID=8319 RepID=A0AAV7TYY7_PLEWA|nr:hypothetical protein NDU88_006586 [Pleurodeles waltl]
MLHGSVTRGTSAEPCLFCVRNEVARQSFAWAACRSALVSHFNLPQSARSRIFHSISAPMLARSSDDVRHSKLPFLSARLHSDRCLTETEAFAVVLHVSCKLRFVYFLSAFRRPAPHLFRPSPAFHICP